MTGSALKRIYEPAAYELSSLQGCYWAQTETATWSTLTGEATAEFAIIGAGFTGLSAAQHLTERGANVIVLEMHAPGFGASGRNGGFCCAGGSLLSSDEIAARWGEEDARLYRAAEKAAVALVAEKIDTLGLKVDRHSEGEVQLAHRPKDFASLRMHADLIRRDYGVEVELLAPADLVTAGLKAEGFHGGLRKHFGFAINPMKYTLGLARAAAQGGARIHGESAVIEIRRDGGAYVLLTAAGQVRAKHLLLATNGYSADNLPPWMHARYLPMQSSVMVTRALTDKEIAAQGWSSDLMAYDSRNLIHYFRLMPDRRMLFGLSGTTRWTPAAHAAHYARLRADFERMFPAWRNVEAPWFWSGLLALSRERVPYVGPVGDWSNAHAAFAYHGNGLAMATWAGAQMARLALGEPTDLPGFLSRRPKRFEIGRWRRFILPFAAAAYGLVDL